MTAKAIYTRSGWRLMQFSIALLTAGSLALLLLWWYNGGFKVAYLTLIITPLLLVFVVWLSKCVRLAFRNDGIYRESGFFKRRSLLVPWRHIQRIDKKKMGFYAPLQKVTIYLTGNRKVQFIMPHAEEFIRELQFKVF